MVVFDWSDNVSFDDCQLTPQWHDMEVAYRWRGIDIIFSVPSYYCYSSYLIFYVFYFYMFCNAAKAYIDLRNFK